MERDLAARAIVPLRSAVSLLAHEVEQHIQRARRTLATHRHKWKHPIQAAPAVIATIRTAEIARMLDDLPRVANMLRYRRGGIAPEMLFRKIPGGVKLAGEKAIRDYLSNHDLSHARSVKHNPTLASNSDNVLFELMAINRARGAADMTTGEQWTAVARNAVANVAGARVVMTAVTKGAALGVLVELPMTATVETLHVINHNKPVKNAARDAAKTVGMSGLAGGATAGMLTSASAFGFTLGAPVVIPLAVAGGSVYVVVSAKRIWEAMGDETRGVVQAAFRDGADLARRLAWGRHPEWPRGEVKTP